MNKILMFSFFLIFCQMGYCQNSNQFLVGEWRLSSLINKRISESEKQKRYVFSLDSLYYKMNTKLIVGAYKYDLESKVIEWTLKDTNASILFEVEKINENELYLKEKSNPDVIGVLKRVSEDENENSHKTLKIENDW